MKLSVTKKTKQNKPKQNDDNSILDLTIHIQIFIRIYVRRTLINYDGIQCLVGDPGILKRRRTKEVKIITSTSFSVHGKNLEFR